MHRVSSAQHASRELSYRKGRGGWDAPEPLSPHRTNSNRTKPSQTNRQLNPTHRLIGAAQYVHGARCTVHGARCTVVGERDGNFHLATAIRQHSSPTTNHQPPPKHHLIVNSPLHLCTTVYEAHPAHPTPPPPSPPSVPRGGLKPPPRTRTTRAPHAHAQAHAHAPLEGRVSSVQ